MLGPNDAASSGSSPVVLTPLVGRDEDVALVLARFELVRDGQGQVVLVTGEAGIGKSRLLQEVRDRLQGEPLVALECRASPFYTDDALHPITEMLSRLAGLADGQDAADQRGRLARVLETLGAGPEAFEVLAEALSLNGDTAPLDLTPQKRKQKTMEALVRLVLAAAERRPVLLAVEDLHWLDPSSDEVLGALVRQCAGAAVLVFATARPGTTPAWAGEDHVTRLALRRLTRKQTESLVARVAGASELPPAVLEQVLGRTDGIPLFAEELTRALLEVARTDAEGRKPTADSLVALVPATLQESLAARLDRLGPAKATAQLASVLGREFPLGWLEAVSPLPAESLRRDVSALVEAGLLQSRGHAPATSYAFKHALVQEAAYAALLKATRTQYHDRVARALEERFPQTAAAEPHLVAHHHAEAGHVAEAALWWSRAAERAAARFASREAVASLGKALGLVATLPAGPERDGRELDAADGPVRAPAERLRLCPRRDRARLPPGGRAVRRVRPRRPELLGAPRPLGLPVRPRPTRPGAGARRPARDARAGEGRRALRARRPLCPGRHARLPRRAAGLARAPRARHGRRCRRAVASARATWPAWRSG